MAFDTSDEDVDLSEPLIGEMVKENRLGTGVGGAICGVGAAALGMVHSGFMAVAMAIGGATIGAYIGGMLQEELRATREFGRAHRFLRQSDVPT